MKDKFVSFDKFENHKFDRNIYLEDITYQNIELSNHLYFSDNRKWKDNS